MSEALLANQGIESEKTYGAWTHIGSASNSRSELKISSTQYSSFLNSSKFPILIISFELNKVDNLVSKYGTVQLRYNPPSDSRYGALAYSGSASGLHIGNYLLNKVFIRYDLTDASYYDISGDPNAKLVAQSWASFDMYIPSTGYASGVVGQLTIHFLGLKNTLGF